MARAIHDAMTQTGVLVAEAGTGTGKTFAYLVPALLAGGKVIISTGTKTLQDQLFDRDLPAVRAALASGASAALLKGRANYVASIACAVPWSRGSSLPGKKFPSYNISGASLPCRRPGTARTSRRCLKTRRSGRTPPRLETTAWGRRARISATAS